MNTAEKSIPIPFIARLTAGDALDRFIHAKTQNCFLIIQAPLLFLFSLGGREKTGKENNQMHPF